jgi:hypothetical protein
MSVDRGIQQQERLVQDAWKRVKKNISNSFPIFFFFFYDPKLCPKNRKNKFRKPYLEVSNSIRDGVRAFFRFSPGRKFFFFFQMSQTARLEILCCVMVLKVFFKKRISRSKKLDRHGQSKTVWYDSATQPAISLACLSRLLSSLQLSADFLKRFCLSSLLLQKQFVMILRPGLPTAQLGLACLSHSLLS